MVRLDCAERRILLDDGTFLPYDRLLLATGAYYLLPPVPRLKEAENVYGFRDLSDALAIDKAVKPGARAVIIGSGLVGMDAAYALMERGISPVIVEMADRILPLQLDAKAASEYQRLFGTPRMQLPAGSQGKPDPSGFPGQCKRPGSGGRRRTGL